MQIENLFNVKDSVIMITGASRGIGKGLALELGLMGAKIVLISRDQNNLLGTAQELETKGITTLAISTDVTDSDQVKSAVDQVVERFGRIDGLINSAGVVGLQPIAEFDETLWDQVMAVNLKGTFLTCKWVGAQMLKQKGGKIINISSVRGLQGRRNDAAYAPSKGAVNLLTKSLAIEWAEDNINVNAIAPTFTLTDINRDLLANEEASNWVLSRIPKKRLGQIEDLVGSVIFLLSPASDFVTGHILYVDGGWTAA